jgi:hypothetical protein
MSIQLKCHAVRFRFLESVVRRFRFYAIIGIGDSRHWFIAMIGMPCGNRCVPTSFIGGQVSVIRGQYVPSRIVYCVVKLFSWRSVI